MEQKLYKEELLQIFPKELKKRIAESVPFQEVTEIRLRAALPISIVTAEKTYFLKKEGGLCRKKEQGRILSKEELKMIFERITQYSVFAYKEEIGEGFITVKGGHRVGLCGKYYYEEGKKRQIKDISSLNIRVAREIKNCAISIIPWLFEQGEFCHTLLISPPGKGKTTYLRDIIRFLSDGTEKFAGKNISVIDERSEIGNRTREGEGFYLGSRTDLMDHCPKAEGMLLMLRTMTPEILAADEIGGEEDIRAIAYVRNCGCRLLMTVHGNSLTDIMERPFLGDYLKRYPFERYVFLSKEKEEKREAIIYNQKKEKLWRGKL